MSDGKLPTVIQALSSVMDDVRAVRKGDRNPDQGYMFRGIDAITNAVGPAFRKHGVVPVPLLESATYRDVQTSRGKPSHEVTVQVRYRFYGPAGDHIETLVPGEAMDFQDKGTAKAMSVAMRIALLQMLVLPTDEPDPDSYSYERENTPPPPPPITPQQLKHLHAAFGDLGITDRVDGLAYIADTIGREVSSSKDLTRAEASDVIDRLRSQLDAAVAADKAAAESSDDEPEGDAEQPTLPEGEGEKA